MSLDIYFQSDIANRDALALALGAGADRRELQIARFAYKSALDHARRAFGLERSQLTVILQGEVVLAEKTAW